MRNAETARQIAVETLRAIGGDQAPVSESWLVQRGYIVGRRYLCGDFSAVWFFDAAKVKVYDPAGKVLKVVAESEMKRAA